MDEKYLTLKQNLPAARVFLNTFGFTLEESKDINEFSRIKIYDKEMNAVGELYFDNGKVIINAKYNNHVLNANYEIAKIKGFTDIENDNALFGEWFSKINFQIENNEDIKINGEFSLINIADTQFGSSCTAHALLNCKGTNNENITIQILREGLEFGFVIKDHEYTETLNIRLWDPVNGFILHDIRKKYDEQKGYPYRKYAGVFHGNENNLHVFSTEDEYNNNLSQYSKFVPKEDNYTTEVIQKGLLMQQLDDSVIKKINYLRSVLLIDDTPLLDNLISVCYDSYTDEELYALLGINRVKMTYQNGKDNLKDSYFGSEFQSQEKQNRLLKEIKS